MIDGSSFTTAFTMALVVSAVVGGAGLSWLICWDKDETNESRSTAL